MSRFATSSGFIEYEILEAAAENSGGAATLTLLHNFMSTGRMAWGALLAELNQRYRILLLDLPGHGRSEGYPPGFDHIAIAQQVGTLMQAVGADRGHLAGCSSGGMIAQLLVQHQLVTPATLTLISTTYSVNPVTTGVATTLDPQDFRASANWLTATAQLHDVHRNPGYFDTELLPGFRQLTPETAIDLPLAALGRWTLPVCLVHGGEDEVFPVAIVWQMAQVLHDAEVHVVPGQGHALIFRQPGVVSRLMLNFLAIHPAGIR